MAAASKLISIFILAVLGISMAATQVMAKESKYHLHSTVRYGHGSVKINQCPTECNRRCGRTQHRKPCMFFCQKCCRKCLCVPPGFYGNKEACGTCYSSWKTKRGGPKCP